MEIKIDKKLGLILYGCGAFLYSSTFRKVLFGVLGISLPWWIADMNLIAAAAVILLVIFCINDELNVSKLFLMFAVFGFGGLAFLSNYYSSVTLSTREYSYFLLFLSLLPGMVLLIPDYRSVDFHLVFKRFLQIYNVFFGLIFVVSILDYFLGGMIRDVIIGYAYDMSGSDAIRGQAYRLYTVSGPPLVNSFYGLAMMVMNKLYAKKYDEVLIPLPLVYALAFVAILLTGSRTAFLLAIVFMLFAEFVENLGVGRIVFIIIALLIIVNTPFFQDTIGYRLEQGIMNQSDDRYKLFVRMMSGDFGVPGIFIGGGYNFSRELTAVWYATYLNFEYPLLMFLYDYGILATVLYYGVFLIYPIFRMLRNKGFFACIGYGIVFVYLQTFNGLAQNYDLNLEMGFFALLCIYCSGKPVRKEAQDGIPADEAESELLKTN